MSSVKGIPAFWNQFSCNVMAMVNQLGIPTYFLKLLCANLRWKELPYVIDKLKNVGLNIKELKKIGYREQCNLLNNNQFLVASYLHYKFSIFFEGIILNGQLGKTKYCARSTEFQEKGSPHAHLLIWIFNAPDIQNETAYIEFIEETIHDQLPGHSKDPKVFELVKAYQVYVHYTFCWK